MQTKVSIILPVIRPDKAKRCIRLLKKNAGIEADRFEIITEEDTDRIGCPKMVEKLLKKTQHSYVCFIGDDCLPQKDFLRNALVEMKRFKNGIGLIGFNDMTSRQLPTHWLAHKDILKAVGGQFFHTGYAHCFCDNELMMRAMQKGYFYSSLIAVIKHENPVLDKSVKSDDDYDRVYSDTVYGKDKRLFDYRKRHNWTSPNNELRLGIALPLTDIKIPMQFFISYEAMKKPEHQLIVPKFPASREYANMGHVRNELVENAFLNNCTHLIMMDTDQVYPGDAITKILEHNLDIVAGVVHRRWPPFDPIIMRGSIGKYKAVSEEECYSGDLIEADATGCGFVCFNMKVFETIPKPWFEILEKDIGHIGEDVSFYSKIKDYGFKLHIDTSIEIVHLTEFGVTKEFHRLYKQLISR